MEILKTVNLTKEFNRKSGRFTAVQSVNFSIYEGELIHIVGRSGSGKTTFLNLLSGILRPTSGEVYVGNELINEMQDEKQSEIRNSILGFVPQSLGTLPNLTVLDNVRLPYFFLKRSGDGIERAAMLLDMLGIIHLKNEYCNSLSGGELKRVMIARALMNDTKLLIADEPTADLDTETTESLMESLVKLNKEGIAMLIVTHEIDILKYGNVVYEMKDGKLSRKENQFMKE